jgi:hypothetical protein
MATAEEGFMKKLAVYATLAVLAHAVIVVWPSVGAGEDSAWTHRSTGSVGGYRDQCGPACGIGLARGLTTRAHRVMV